MKKLFTLICVIILLIVAVPFAGPWLGLASNSAATPPPGTSIQLTAGRTLNVYRGGKGPLVVLVHGRPGYGHFMKPLALYCGKTAKDDPVSGLAEVGSA